jgi:xanthine dehydrogenase YagR molybdenum-binding subunit
LIEETYTTALYTHNPLEPHATVATWDGGSLTLYDTTQGLFDCRARVARIFGLRKQAVRVVSTYLGGGFGSKGPVWSHVILAAMAARQLGRPVKLVLTRPQMFGPVGSRSRTRQTVALGASPAGGLRAMRHDTLAETSTFDDYMEACGMPARTLYAAAARATSHRFVRSNIGTPSYMRAPGWAPGTFALECALDELAEALRMDPLELRVRNHAARHPRSQRPWSCDELRACYQIGAARFGWSRRPSEPGRLRRGQWRIGWGVAGSVYPVHHSPASARVRLREDGSLYVETGSQDIGTGTYTILTQIAAEAFGVRPADVTLRLGDTEYPETPMSGGSQTAVSAGVAVQEAAAALRRKVVRLAIADPAGPLHRTPLEAVVIDDGRIFDSRNRNGGRGEGLRAFLARQKRPRLEARAHAQPRGGLTRYAAYAFGAQFAEVHVDADLGRVRVARMVGVFDVGRVLNAKTARSQLMGGMVGGIGMALHEATDLDERLGRVVNADLGEYHVPVQADVPEIDVSWIGTPDEHANPLGAKGIGELGITGTAAAIANAVFHATRRRVRDLPIRLDRLL